jgi:acetyl-CoA synthetase
MDTVDVDIDLGTYDSYEAAYEGFEWDVPETFNVAEAVCRRWADAPDGKRRVALFYEGEDGRRETYTFWRMQREANRVSNALADIGVGRGTRVGIVLPQRPENLIANLAVLQMGGIVVPLSVLYGSEGLRYRLDHSETEVVIAGEQRAGLVEELRPGLDALESVITVDAPDVGGHTWEEAVRSAPPEFGAVETGAEDSAYVIYTSGTTGKPKGAHHAHRQVLGYVPGWQLINEFPDESAVHYSPSGWAWVGGLFAVVWGAWFHGQPVVGYGGDFEPEAVYRVLDEYGVTHTLLTPTMVRMMREVDYRGELDVEVVPSGGEKVSRDVHRFVEEEWGAVVNEIYGQTECNFLVGTNHELMEMDYEATGRPVPGHVVSVVDEETGEELPPNEIGHIAVKRPNPGMLLDYWHQPELTEELFVGDWMLTGDAGSFDEDGYLHYEGRADDVIITAGYRVSPLEVEDTLREHEAVANAVVIGVDDEERGQVVKAFLKLEPGFDPSEELAEEVRTFVREREAAYKYPRQVEFVEEFPTTVTGKVQRRKLKD